MYTIKNMTELEPYIYNIRKNNNVLNNSTDKFCLEYQYKNFNLPKKIYGSFEKDAEHILNYFLNSNKSLGTMFTGSTGSGKTLTSKLICNKALLNKLPVFIVSGINIDNDVIEFLNNLNNCVIFLDEFGKLTSQDTQAIMLQMLTDTNKRILWIFANKDSYQIHREFFNRTERIRYYINYGKISKDVVIEYCKDHNVCDEFIKEILLNYDHLEEFSFDQLQGLVTEHLYVPEQSLEEISRLLNYKGFELKVNIRPTDCSVNNNKYEVTAYKVVASMYGDNLAYKHKTFSYRTVIQYIKNFTSFIDYLSVNVVLKNKETNESITISNFHNDYMYTDSISNITHTVYKDYLNIEIYGTDLITKEELKLNLKLQLFDKEGNIIDID